jgi:hypothetical protein
MTAATAPRPTVLLLGPHGATLAVVIDPVDVEAEVLVALAAEVAS